MVAIKEELQNLQEELQNLHEVVEDVQEEQQKEISDSEMQSTHKIVELTFSKSVTIQMRDYEPANIHISAKVELTEDTPESRELAYNDIKQLVTAQLASEQKELVEKRKQLRNMEQGAEPQPITPQTNNPMDALLIESEPQEPTTGYQITPTQEDTVLVDEYGNEVPFN